MAANIAEIQTKVSSRIQDKAGRLSTTPLTGDVARCILAALEQYGKDRPLVVVLEIEGAGAFDYPVADLAGFVDGFSSIERIVYPYDEDDQSDEALDAEAYTIKRLPAGLVLRFLEASPAEAESFLVEFTRPHTLDASTSTVPAADDEALADLAAAHCCEELAAHYAQSTDSSISADSVDRRSQSAEYRALAKVYANRYADKVGKGEAKPKAAGRHVEVDRGFAGRRREDYLFHGRRYF